MRSRWPSLVLLAVLILAGAGPLRAQERANNVVVVDPSADEPPPNLLADEEVARISRLQTETVVAVPVSPVSPDDQVVLVSSEERIGLLNIQDGSSVAFDAEAFSRYAPLPLLGISAFSWLDARTLGALAVDFGTPRQDEALVRMRIDRETLRISTEVVRFPERTALVSVAPSLDRFLLVLFPPDEGDGEGGAEGAAAIRLEVGAPRPARPQPEQIAVPPQVRRGLERALRSPAMARLALLQEGPEGDELVVTPETVDLLLFSSAEPGMRYVTTVPAASTRLGEAWTRDSGRLAISFTSLSDVEHPRPDYDGALLSEELYRDVTGNLPPAENPIIQNNNTYVIDFASGATQILRPGGEAPPILGADAWSTDNQTLMVKAWHPARIKGRAHPIYTPQFTERASYRFYDLALNEVGRLESDQFSGGAASMAEAAFISPDEVIFRAVQGTDRHPYYYNRVSGELRNLAGRAGTYGAITATNASRQIVFVYQSFTDPPEIYRLGWDGAGLARLTWANEELRLSAGLRQDPVSFTLRGGQRRSGVLIQPAAAPFPPRDARVVVWQEGGPGVAMLNFWATNVENPGALLPASGIAVLVTPLAGRPGYTPAAFNALADGANFGSVDIDEQAEIVGQLIARGWTSRGKVGITGCSYGGYFALQSIVRHPDLYAAANPQCALVDVLTEWSRGYATLMPHLQGVPPYSNPEEYRRDSPIYGAGRIRAAVLTFHGTEDFLPVVQNENLHLQLAARGVTARMVKFLGEGHGLREPVSQLYAAQEQIAWFRAHLDE